VVRPNKSKVAKQCLRDVDVICTASRVKTKKPKFPSILSYCMPGRADVLLITALTICRIFCQSPLAMVLTNDFSSIIIINLRIISSSSSVILPFRNAMLLRVYPSWQ
jgi:hypothetical protein